MGSRASSWLLLSLVVLTALAVAELRYQVGTGSGGTFAVQGSAPAVDSPAPRFALADSETFSETLSRPLFMPNRKPPEVADPDSPEPAPPVGKTKPNRYALSAIIIVDDERIALLTNIATGELSRVREGESVGGARVKEISEQSAVLIFGDSRQELPLRTFGPPVLVSKSRRATTGAKRKAATGTKRKAPTGAKREQPAPRVGAATNSALPKRPRRSKRRARLTGRIPGTEAN